MPKQGLIWFGSEHWCIFDPPCRCNIFSPLPENLRVSWIKITSCDSFPPRQLFVYNLKMSFHSFYQPGMAWVIFVRFKSVVFWWASRIILCQILAKTNDHPKVKKTIGYFFYVKKGVGFGFEKPFNLQLGFILNSSTLTDNQSRSFQITY